MHTLPASMAAMAAYRQFILVRFSPHPARPGRTEKFPIDFRTGKVASAHDPEVWLDAATACGLAAVWGGDYGVGFVFTAADPFWFVDIDHAATDGGWSDLARQVFAAFPGAAVEVSQSGTGLHLFGTGVCPPHACKNVPLDLELYTEGRFVALTGNGAAGDSGTQHDAALRWIVETYFPERIAAGAAHDGAGPRSDWNGPTDDDELLRRALRSTSTGSMFGAKASFRDLWEGNVDALSRAYPGDGRAFDGSSADAALAQHLAFWTGCDTERMERLMRASALTRPKWDERDDYLVDRTIRGACARQQQVLTDAVPEDRPGPPVDEETAPRPSQKVGAAFCGAPEQIELFKGCVYIQDAHRVLAPGGHLLKPDQFKVIYGGRSFAMDAASEKVSKDAWEAFTQSQMLTPPQADGTCFRPDLPAAHILHDAGRTRANTWWPVAVPRAVGDAGPFLAHLKKLLPYEEDREILLAYMCACVQHKGTKFQWAPVIQGVEGNGKTMLSRCVAEAIGNRYVHWPKASKIAKQFNGWMVGKLFYAVEDIYTSEGTVDVIEELKPMITGGYGLEIEAKGVDQVSAEIVGNFMFNTNHETGVKKTRNDRRFCTFACAQQAVEDLVRDGMAGGYMNDLYNWLNAGGFAVVSELLHTRPIPDHLNPATRCQRAPATSSTERAIEMSVGFVEQEIQEAVAQGLPGFAGGWVSSVFLDRLLERLRKSSAVPPNRRLKMMESLGFIRHPALPEGRVTSMVLPDAAKPRLYVRPDSPGALLTRPADVARAYTSAQTAGATLGV